MNPREAYSGVEQVQPRYPLPGSDAGEEPAEHLHPDELVQVSQSSVAPGKARAFRQNQSYLLIPDLSPLCLPRLVEE